MNINEHGRCPRACRDLDTYLTSSVREGDDWLAVKVIDDD